MDLATLLSNPYFSTTTKILLLIYASQIVPTAPSFMIDLFRNAFVKIGLIALLMYLTLYDFQYSLIFAIILVLGMNAVSGRSLFESYVNIDNVADFSKTFTPSGKFTLLEPNNHIFPGCANITQAELLRIFDNDNYKLHKSAQHAFYELLKDSSVDAQSKDRLLSMARKAGLPYNIEINDENAPHIATLLVNYNFIITDTCRPPQ